MNLFKDETKSFWKRLAAVISFLLLVVGVVVVVLVVDLKRASVENEFRASSLVLDGRHAGPEAQLEVSLSYDSQYSTVELQSMICTIESGEIHFDMTPISLAAAASDIDDNGNLVGEESAGQVYSVEVSCPEEDIESFADLTWNILVDQKKDSLGGKNVAQILEEGTCSVSVRVYFGNIVPLDVTINLPLMDLIADREGDDISSNKQQDEDMNVELDLKEEPDNKEDSVKDDISPIDFREPTFEWIRIQEADFDAVKMAFCLAMPDAFESMGLSMVRLRLPALYLQLTPSETVGMTVDMEEIDTTFSFQEKSSNHCANFLMASQTSGLPFYRPILDLSISDASTAIDIGINGAGSFVETLLGQDHRLNIHRKAAVNGDEGDDVFVRQRQLESFSPEEFEDAYRGAAARCLKVDDENGTFDFGLCAILEIPQETIALLGSMAFYDYDMTGISTTSWGRKEDEIEIETNALVSVTNEPVLMNFTGSFLLDYSDTKDILANAATVNRGSVLPFEGIVNVNILVRDDVVTAVLNNATFMLEKDGLANMAGNITFDLDALTIEADLADPSNNYVMKAEGLILTDNEEAAKDFQVTGESTCIWDSMEAWDMAFTLFRSWRSDDISTMAMEVDEFVSGYGSSGDAIFNIDRTTLTSNLQLHGKDNADVLSVDGVVDMDGEVDFKMTGSSALNWSGTEWFKIATSATFDFPENLLSLELELSETLSSFFLAGAVEYDTDLTKLAANLTHGQELTDLVTLQGQVHDDTDFRMTGTSTCVWGGSDIWDGELLVTLQDENENNNGVFIDALLSEREKDFSMRVAVEVDDGHSIDNQDKIVILLQEFIVELDQETEIDANGVLTLDFDNSFFDMDIENTAGHDFMSSMKLVWFPSGARMEEGIIISLDGSKQYLQVVEAEIVAAADDEWDASSLILDMIMPYSMGKLSGRLRYEWDVDEEKLSFQIDDMIAEWDAKTHLDLDTKILLDLDDALFGFSLEETAGDGLEGNISISIFSEDAEGPFNVDQWFWEESTDISTGIKIERLFWRAGADTFFDSVGSILLEDTSDDGFCVSSTFVSGEAAYMQMNMTSEMRWIEEEDYFVMTVDRMVMGWKSTTFVEMPLEVRGGEMDNQTPSPIAPPPSAQTTIAPDPPLEAPTGTPQPDTPTTAPQRTNPPTTPATIESTLPPPPDGMEFVKVEDIDMYLSGVVGLTPEGFSAFGRATESFYETFYMSPFSRRQLNPAIVSNFETSVLVTGQQVNGTGNTITYTQELRFGNNEYTGTGTDKNAVVIELLEYPFADNSRVLEYLTLLQSKGDTGLYTVTDAALDVLDVSVVASDGDKDNETENDAATTENPTDSFALSTGAIIGIAVGCAAFLCLFGTGMIVYFKNLDRGTEENDYNRKDMESDGIDCNGDEDCEEEDESSDEDEDGSTDDDESSDEDEGGSTDDNESSEEDEDDGDTDDEDSESEDEPDEWSTAV